MSTAKTHLHQQMLLLQDKRRYFLLGASVTAMGFSVTQISPENASTALWLLIIALIALAGSLIFGLSAIATTDRLLMGNYKYLEVYDEATKRGFPQNELMEIASQETFDPLGKQLRFKNVGQFWLLALGVALIPSWKIMSCAECVAVLAETLD